MPASNIDYFSSFIRALHFISSKLDALELLGKVSHYVPDEIILDRILPYTVSSKEIWY